MSAATDEELKALKDLGLAFFFQGHWNDSLDCVDAARVDWVLILHSDTNPTAHPTIVAHIYANILTMLFSNGCVGKFTYLDGELQQVSFQANDYTLEF